MAAVLEEIRPLIIKHYEEIAWKQDKIALNPDFDRYRDIEEKGGLRIYTAREDGALVGYAIFFVMQHLHYKDKVMAVNDLFFVEHSKRGARVGQKLLKEYAQTELYKEGVQWISLHIKLNHDWSKLAEMWGYEKVEVICMKWIGD
jgi:GNAT superfamily N-acetyltransferase